MVKTCIIKLTLKSGFHRKKKLKQYKLHREKSLSKSKPDDKSRILKKERMAHRELDSRRESAKQNSGHREQV